MQKQTNKQVAHTGYPSTDKPWLKYYKLESLNKPLPKRTLIQNIRDNNQAFLDDIALQYYGNRVSYKMLFTEVDQCARALVSSGLNAGETISLCVVAVPEVISLMLACSQIGVVANFINPLFTTEQIAEQITESKTQSLFVLDVLYKRVADAIDKVQIKELIVIPVTKSMPFPLRTVVQLKNRKKRIDCTFTTWDSFVSRGQDLPVPKDFYLENAPVYTVYSSGSTGKPKGILLTNDGINATLAHYLYSGFDYQRGNTFLQTTPVWYSTGIVLSLMMPLCLGITVIIEPVFSLENFVRDIIKYRPNMFLLGTSMWVHLMQHKKMQNVDLSFVMYPMAGGDKLRARTEIQIRDFLRRRNCNAKLMKGWGMCELGSTVTSDSPLHYNVGSAGYPLLNIIVSVFDIDTDKELKYNQHGEIRVLTPTRMKEYHDNPEATAEFFKTDKEGRDWACTGDIGYMNEDGILYVLGRATDHYIAEDGSKQYCFDAEDVIMQEEAIANCKVLGINRGNGQYPVAHIILEDNNTEKIEQILSRLHKNCVSQLSKVAVPQAYKVQEEFPIVAGKLNKLVLETNRSNFLDPEGKPLEIL